MIAGAEFARRYDAHMAGGLMDLYYGAGSFFNAGLWDGPEDSVEEAGERLVGAVAAAIPAGARSILDVGCGLGGTTRSLARRFPSARVVGLNVSLGQLAGAGAAGPRTKLVCADAARLPLARESVDAVAAVESLQHVPGRRAFFAEARSILRDEGCVTFSDMLVRDPDAFGAWMFPDGERIESLAAYRAMLASAGWTAIELTDATEACWIGFCRSWERFAGRLHDAGRIDRAELERHRALVRRWEDGAVYAYVIGSARKGSAP